MLHYLCGVSCMKALANTCCFIGHRKIEVTNCLVKNLTNFIDSLIQFQNVTTFLFGSKSEFDELCFGIVSKLKNNYPYIKRIYIRSHYECIDDRYMKYLLKHYDDTIFPKECFGSGKISYIKRNLFMIDKSDFCKFYFNQDYLPPIKIRAKKIAYQPKSGTALAFNYAKQKNKSIVNFFG